MKCLEKHRIIAVFLLLLVPIYMISCTGNANTSLPSSNSSAALNKGEPTKVNAVGSDSRAVISWEPPQNAITYNLYWNTTGGVTKDSNKILNVYIPFDHRDLMNGKTYFYRVSAVYMSGESDLSAEVQATPMSPFTKILTKLTDPDAEVGEEFGRSVSIDGDYAVVGARNSSRLDPNNFIPGTGAAYVFHRTNGTWDPMGTKLMASDAQYQDHFGGAVSISGDYVIVGADGEDGGPGDPRTSAGAAYIFHRTGVNTWDGGVKIASPYPLAFSRFGYSVSISGDYAVVGQNTYYENVAYVFHRTGTNAWESLAVLEMPNSECGDRFGSAVAINGDYVIVGAYNEHFGLDNSIQYAGAAYVFHRTGTNSWELVSKIMPHDSSAVAQFGIAVAINGDYAAVAASSQTGGRGSVYVFHRLDENFWDEGPKLTAPDAQEDDHFGWSVAITDKFVLVGAPYEDCGWDENMSEGSAYLFKRIGANTWDGGTKITISEGDIADSFGYAVAISGEDAMIGAVGDDTEGNDVPDAGAVYLY